MCQRLQAALYRITLKMSTTECYCCISPRSHLHIATQPMWMAPDYTQPPVSTWATSPIRRPPAPPWPPPISLSQLTHRGWGHLPETTSHLTTTLVSHQNDWTPIDSFHVHCRSSVRLYSRLVPWDTQREPEAQPGPQDSQQCMTSYIPDNYEVLHITHCTVFLQLKSSHWQLTNRHP